MLKKGIMEIFFVYFVFIGRLWYLCTLITELIKGKFSSVFNNFFHKQAYEGNMIKVGICER